MLIGSRHELPHPLWAILEQFVCREADHCAARSAQVSAHTTAERQMKALEVVVIPSLGLRDKILWRGPLNEPRPLSKPFS
jgi:hypothetical protein